MDLDASPDNMDLDDFSLFEVTQNSNAAKLATPINDTNVEEEHPFDTKNKRAQAFCSQITKMV